MGGVLKNEVSVAETKRRPLARNLAELCEKYGIRPRRLISAPPAGQSGRVEVYHLDADLDAADPATGAIPHKIIGHYGWDVDASET